MDQQSMAILILLGSFFLMILLRFPIAYAVALASILRCYMKAYPLRPLPNNW